MDLSSKLQLKHGQGLELVDLPAGVSLGMETSPAAAQNGLLVFVRSSSEYEARRAAIVASAQVGRLTWVAYPKARQLGTDLDRDRLAALFHDDGIDPVRQIAIDGTWSALRVRPL
jgi:hypothetical protein